jgi:hypothetical protein
MTECIPKEAILNANIDNESNSSVGSTPSQKRSLSKLDLSIMINYYF